MDLSRVEKKLREAQFFLDRMVEQEKRSSGDQEHFDFYLNAFLNAARTVDYRLRHEQEATYSDWRKKWDAVLTPTQDALVNYLVKDRNVEVHARGSNRKIGQEATQLRGASYSDQSELHEYSAPPDAGPATIIRLAHFFDIGGTERKAVDACKEYLDLLNMMVKKFEAGETS
jgi:hypothetical protein